MHLDKIYLFRPNQDGDSVYMQTNEEKSEWQLDIYSTGESFINNQYKATTRDAEFYLLEE